MNSCELTMSVAALANAFAAKLNSPEEISAVAAVFMQLGYTMESIAAQQELCNTCKSSDNCSHEKNNL